MTPHVAWASRPCLFSSLCLCVSVFHLLFFTPARAAEAWDYKKEFLPFLTDPIPDLLKKQNKQTGAFGDEPWICTDQNLIYPLAAAWSIKDPANPWYHKDELLTAIMLGGDKLIAEAKPNGQWI